MSHWPSDNLNREYVLAARLRDHGVEIFAGTTDVEMRRERFREAIVNGPGASAIVGRSGGKSITYAQAFEQLYAQPLEAKR